MTKKELKVLVKKQQELLKAQALTLKVADEGLIKQGALIANLTQQLANQGKSANPVDVIDSIVVQGLINLDNSDVYLDVNEVNVLTDLRCTWSEIREEKGLNNE